jgi:hypothetical protein
LGFKNRLVEFFNNIIWYSYIIGLSVNEKREDSSGGVSCAF